MTNEQCIEVAEKVWGLSADNILGEYNEYLCEVEYQTNKTKDEWLRDAVNSWQGFGRTVEAMEKRWGDKLNPMEEYMDSKIKDCHLSRFLLPLFADWMHHFSYPKDGVNITNQNPQDDNSKYLIEFTHLAALEAING